MKKKSVIVISIVGILALMGALLVQVERVRAAKERQVASESSGEDFQEMRDAVDELKHQVSLDRQVLASRLASSAAIDLEDHTRGATQPSPRAEPKTRAPTEVELVQQLDEVFKTDGTGAAWSRGAADTMNRVLSANLGSASTLKMLECRQTICRAETRHKDIDEFQRFMRASFLSRDSGLWNGAMASWVVERDSTGVVAVSFVAKEGVVFPSAEMIVEN